MSNGNPHQAYTTQIALLTESSAHFSCMPGRSRHSPGRVQHDLLSQTATCRVDLVADQVDVPVKAASAGAFWRHLDLWDRILRWGEFLHLFISLWSDTKLTPEGFSVSGAKFDL